MAEGGAWGERGGFAAPAVIIMRLAATVVAVYSLALEGAEPVPESSQQ